MFKGLQRVLKSYSAGSPGSTAKGEMNLAYLAGCCVYCTLTMQDRLLLTTPMQLSRLLNIMLHFSAEIQYSFHRKQVLRKEGCEEE